MKKIERNISQNYFRTERWKQYGRKNNREKDYRRGRED